MKAMRLPDLDRERSERQLSLPEFITMYNEGLPSQFPRVSQTILREFQKTHPSLFKRGNLWSLDQHRKTVMNWLPSVTTPH